MAERAKKLDAPTGQPCVTTGPTLRWNGGSMMPIGAAYMVRSVTVADSTRRMTTKPIGGDS